MAKSHGQQKHIKKQKVHSSLSQKKKKNLKAQSHDLFFKRIFSTIKKIVEFLKVTVPQKILDLFDLSTTRVEKDVFVKGLEMRIDLLLTILFKNSKQKAKLLLLLEHKSFIDKTVIKKLLSYQVMAYEKYNYPVFCMIFYHGRQKWTAPRSFHEFLVSEGHLPQAALKELGPYLMNFSPYIFDLSKFDIDQKGKVRLNPILHAFQNIWSLKGSNTKEQQKFLKKFFLSMKKLSKNHKKDYIINMVADIITYFYQYNPNLSKKVLQKASQEVTKEFGGHELMEALDLTLKGTLKKGITIGEKKGIAIGEKKGIAIGEKKGIAIGEKKGIGKILLKLLKVNISVEEISKITGISKQEILKLQKKVTTK